MPEYSKEPEDLEAILSRIGVKPGTTFVGVGCGRGFLRCRRLEYFEETEM
ncbi:hypothetical protein ACFLT4_01690 [Chloroflexota bacterium]